MSGFQALAAAEGGWDRVPYDDYPTLLHKDEMVLPRGLAEGVRQMTAAGIKLPDTSRPSLGGASTIVNSSGDTNHTATLNHSPTINNFGSGSSSADTARALRQSNAFPHSTLQERCGKGALKLPGR